jgi:Peptidase A4 family
MKSLSLYAIVAAALFALMAFAASPAGTASAGTGLRPSGVATAHPPIPDSGQGFVSAPGHAALSGALPGAIGTAYSTTWAGYAATGNTFKKVSAIFSVPSVNCTVTPNAFSYHWAGLDGFGNPTGERAGVASLCYQGSPHYWAWYEMLPESLVVDFTLKPGDATQSTVSYNSSTGNYTLTVRDVTSRQSFTVNKKCPAGSTCKRNTAEVISEGFPSAPYLGTADYGIENYVDTTLTSSAGHAGGFTDAAWAGWKVIQKRTVVDAMPSGLWGGKAFNITWKALK